MITKPKGIEKGAQRILKAVKNKEGVVFFSDGDVDGIASAVILEEALKELGWKTQFVYIVNREKEGYGLSLKAVDFLQSYAPGLFILLDCGITNFESVKEAQKKGFETIIIDHHEVVGSLPPAEIIIDPKQKEDPYPFKYFSTGGLCYLLAKEIFRQKKEQFFSEKFLELAVLTTIFDRMPIEKDNEKIVSEGILALKYTRRPGLKALLDSLNLNHLDIAVIQEKVLPPLIAGEPKDHQNETYWLLTLSSYEEAKELAGSLILKSKEKKKLIEKIFQEAEKEIEPMAPIIFLGSKSWPLHLAGAVATKLCQRYKRPTFVFKIEGDEARGSVRTPKEINSVKLMNHCASFLISYGGHPNASGFRIKTKNLEAFKKCLIENLSRQEI